MTQFNKIDFNYSGGYLTYGADRKFVARFKYVAGNKAGFQAFLIKNFTVEEYFARLDAREAPAQILGSRGYLEAHIKKLLKKNGYPVDRAGFDKYITDQIEARKQLKVA